MSGLLDKRFVVVAGKGGVGRTTISLVIGHLAANKRKRTLVCLCNAPSRYFDLIGDLSVNDSIQRVSDFLHVVNLQPRSCQEEYALRILKNRTVHKLIFNSRLVRGFLDAVPGLGEWAMLGKATFHALSETDNGPEYDLVVFDSPATGHGLDILALPRAIVSAVPAGRIRDEALLRCALLEDPEKSEVIPVTIPEEIPVNETVEFVRGLRTLNLPVQRLAINMIISSSISQALQTFLDQLKCSSHNDTDAWMLPACVARGHAAAQRHSLEILKRTLPIDHIELPLVPGGSLERSSLQSLIASFGESQGTR